MHTDRRRPGARHRDARSLARPPPGLAVATWPWLTQAVVLALLTLPSPFTLGGAQAESLPAQHVGEGPVGSVPSTAVPVSLSVATNGYELGASFWGTTVSPRAPLLADEGSLVQSTRTFTVLWPGGNAGDDYNPFNNTLVHVQHGLLSWTHAPTSEAQFVAWCRSIGCRAIFQVPGEIDNVSFAEAVVNYTERTLNFTPTYWEIGNEPELWREWQRPWSEWGLPKENETTRIHPGGYAWEVHNYTLAMRSVDPHLQVLGLPGTGRTQDRIPLSTWLNVTVAVDAPLIAGEAFHVYSAGRFGVPGPLAFYAYAQDPYGAVGRVTMAREVISTSLNTSCPNCAPLPIFVTELGSALSHWKYGNLSAGFAGGLAMAVSEVQGMDLDLANMDVYATVFNTSNSWFDLSGAARPDYLVYSEMLSHLGPEVLPASLSPPLQPPYEGSNSSLADNLYAVATRDPADLGRSDLLMVNENLSTWVSLAPQLSGIAQGSPVGLWEWSGRLIGGATNRTAWVQARTPAPVFHFFPQGLPSNWSLPSQTIALFEGYPQGAVPVQLQATGLPSGLRWVYNIDGRTGTTVSPNATLLLTQGAHVLVMPPVAVPYGPFGNLEEERYLPSVPPVLEVTGLSTNLEVPFAHQWRLQVSGSPPSEGTVTPSVGWANATTPLYLSAAPAPGFALLRWKGWGMGAYWGPGPQAKLVPRGPLAELALFAHGFPVLFNETGLPLGTRWSVAMNGQVLATDQSALEFVEHNRTFAFEVGKVDGYRSLPTHSSVRVNGSQVVVEVQFIPLRQLWPAIWNASGLWANVSWAVAVNGQVFSSTRPWLSVELPAGSYPFTVVVPPGYIVSPRTGSIVVQGITPPLRLHFSLATFPIAVAVQGPSGGLNWKLRFSDHLVNLTSAASFSFREPNGSYSWDVVNPPGYYAERSHGNLTVGVEGAEISVTFVPTGVGPRPSVWVLGARAGMVAGMGLLTLGVVYFALETRRRRRLARERARSRRQRRRDLATTGKAVKAREL
ncbi:MAG: hypothetical protein KGJ23_14660 [Euryarchaeota archaeon]|nr:hypothetical protein [Euryarchaeota archaeon]MDE1837842.1 hypothetical protein [Euryarchaeota archaeon]MDE1880126.1 hypothetical protein [Euryarchaeota archaeon]MDE2046297.1 hypothetical protein [Thermoplasmata archaeon]